MRWTPKPKKVPLLVQNNGIRYIQGKRFKFGFFAMDLHELYWWRRKTGKGKSLTKL